MLGRNGSSPRQATTLLLLLVLSLGAACPACAAALAGVVSPSARRGESDAVRSSHRKDLLRDAATAPVAQNVLKGSDEASRSLRESDPREDRAARIAPGLAFLLSAAIPGTGQIAEGRNRAFAYLGAEALAWIAHFSWKDAGNKKEGEYEAYARSHWDLERWKERASGDVDTCQNALPAGVNYATELETIERFLAEGNYQHYYEDIGKLETFRGGWDDYVCAQPDAMSPNRGAYRGMREDSNDFLQKARYATTFAFLNRVVSAVDAYRTARGARVTVGSRTNLELDVRGSLSHPRAMLRIRRQL